MGAGTSPAEPEFCAVIQRTFRELRNGRFSPNLVTKRSSVSRRGIRKDIFEIFTLWIICPQNLKSKIGQNRNLIQSWLYTGHGMYCREILFTPRCSTKGVSEIGQLFCTTNGCGATGRQNCPIFRFWPIFPIRNP